MRVLIDSLSLQAKIHLQDGKRLDGLLQKAKRLAGCETAFSAPAPLSADALADIDVLISATRKIEDVEYTERELSAIFEFVQSGGGLLLMSNHGDIPGRIVVTADSGFIGSGETTFPGVGLMEMGDNGPFIANCLHWLGEGDYATEGSSHRWF